MLFRSCPVLHNAPADAPVVTRLVLCSGKVYHDLVASEAYKQAATVAVARLEQLYPFPSEELAGVLATYASLSEVVWMQEEPRNMGAWSFVAPRVRGVLRDAGRLNLDMRYVGRPESASPAEGSLKRHQSAQGKIITAALSAVPSPANGKPKRKTVNEPRSTT